MDFSNYDRLFISTKDRPEELAILCKSLLHSDMFYYINEVVFLDDHSEKIVEMQRIFSAFMYSALPASIRTRWLDAEEGRKGINQSWDRIKHYECGRIWMLNGDMMVFSNYFARMRQIYDYLEKEYPKDANIVSGFNTERIHPPIHRIKSIRACVPENVGGCSLLTNWKNLDKLMQCFGSEKAMSRGWDANIGKVFDRIFVTDPSASQHVGIFNGLNQLYMSGFPGAWADINT